MFLGDPDVCTARVEMRYMLQQATTLTIYQRYNIYDNCVNDVDGVHICVWSTFSDIDLFVHILYEVYIEVHEYLFCVDVCESDTSNFVYRRVLHVFERYIPVKQFMLPCHI